MGRESLTFVDIRPTMVRRRRFVDGRVAMGILVWTLGLPTVATALAVLWVMWSSRPRGPIETHVSVAEHERFKRAMAQQVRRQAPRELINK